MYIGKKKDRHMILDIGKRMTLVHNTTPYESKSKDAKVSMHNRISLKSVPLFYLAHTLGTKNKWVKNIIKEFVCHKSANKFDIHESGKYIDKFINAENAQYVMVYHIPITDPPSSSDSDSSNRFKIIMFYKICYCRNVFLRTCNFLFIHKFITCPHFI